MWLGMRQSGAWQQHEEGRGLVAPALLYALIHPSAWKGHSANFALTEFYEVRRIRLPRTLLNRPTMLLATRPHAGRARVGAPPPRPLARSSLFAS